MLRVSLETSPSSAFFQTDFRELCFPTNLHKFHSYSTSTQSGPRLRVARTFLVLNRCAVTIPAMTRYLKHSLLLGSSR